MQGGRVIATDRRRGAAARIAVGAVLVAVTAGSWWLDHRTGTRGAMWTWLALLILIAYREACALAVLRGVQPDVWAGSIVLTAALLGSEWGSAWTAQVGWGGVFRAALAYLPAVLLVAVAVRMVLDAARFDAAGAAATVFLGAWMGLVIFGMEAEGRIRTARGAAAGDWFLLFMLLANKASDTAAYAVGSAIGRHRLAPRVSPGKTWEGAVAGAAAGTAAGAWALSRAVPELGTFALIAIAAVVTIAAQVSDLVESAYKRWAGAKDSGDWLPEFGGALDVVDGFLLSAPAAALCMAMAGI
jgi:phosphatidate cytidylyltransferase